jgi:predicted lactoylglutathione lyase
VKPRITIITIAVDDLKKSLAFYREAMGWTPWWPPPGHREPFDHAAFELAGGLSLVLNPRDELAREARVREARPSSTEFTLTYALGSREEVDALLRRAVAAGAAWIGRPVDHPWGYAAELKDPDGHVWEIIWNPELSPLPE